MHTPVLLQQAMEGLQVRPGGLYIDATVGEGGHLREMIKRKTKILAIDVDEDQVRTLKQEFGSENNVVVEVGNFSDIEKIAEKHGFYPVDGILFDLGLSMRQLNDSGRGFSWKHPDELLDMRLDIKQERTAQKIINTESEQGLYEIFSRNSEEIHSSAIAKEIVHARRLKKILLVRDLIEVIRKVSGGIDDRMVARIFQALRIEVNEEFKNLKRGLRGALSIIRRPGGRIVVITFHSLEDRIVKLFAREHDLSLAKKKHMNFKNRFQFERSAKLRIINC